MRFDLGRALVLSALLPVVGFAFGDRKTDGPSTRQILPGDRIEIRSSTHPSLCGVYRISPEGCLTIPGLNQVNLAGLNIARGEDRIRETCLSSSGEFLGDLTVRPLPDEEAPVTIIGFVSHRGPVPKSSARRFSEVIAWAQPTPSADLSRVFVSDASGAEFFLNLSRDGVRRIHPGDRLLVLETARPRDLLILGGVWRPGELAWKPGLTLGQAISASGGITPHGRPDAIVLVRHGVSQVLSETRDSGIVLETGDVIKVTPVEHPLYIGVRGLVVRQGLTPFREGMRLSQVLAAAGGVREGAGAAWIVVTPGDLGHRRSMHIQFGDLMTGGADPEIHERDLVDVYPSDNRPAPPRRDKIDTDKSKW